MVSRKRLDYEFNGYRAPNIPKAPRSIRKRGPRKNSVEDGKLCAFELLAAVAGKLLQESESSASSNVAEGKVHPSPDGNDKGDKALKSDGSCAESAFVPEVSVQDHNMISSFKGQPLGHTSVCANSDILTKVDCDINLGICEVKNVDGNNATSEVESGRDSEDDKNQIGDISTANTSIVKDPIDECVNTDVLFNSENTVQMPFCRDAVNNVNLGNRDDDDNSIGCNKSCTNVRPFRLQPHIGHRRIRKMLTSKYRKGASKLKGCELYKTSGEMKPFYQYRKRIYTQERCQPAPIKKRKLYDTSAVAFDQDTSSDSISNSPEKGMRMDKNSSNVVSERASDASAKGHKKAKDAHVKFSIKSFKVPELYIEVPETASVASLKRTVMEAVTAILGSGIRVGIVLQGKKVRDDNRTLQQAGISQNSNLDTLGFTLEPSFTHV
ncbi:hypothetical protein CDL12_15222 [Handroanthus impetiginosus]|uniref:Ubiquitin-like domain-containing protein n=1 Tax=Handroanthus impetiginosus TaxID=429701 RepID=A0A2G9H3U6_9LAMI|nr:hypothetical protein CDL12_15222 [Handroanthus impetiginosus]